MHWLEASLIRKFAAGTAAGLLISLLVFLILFVGLYRTQLQRERTGAAIQVNRLLQASLENAMLKRDIEGLKGIVSRLGSQPEIHRVIITNPAGEVRFSSDQELLGRQMPPPPEATRGENEVPLLSSVGEDLVRSINPVGNKPQCKECHGPVEKNPINGILYVDYDAAPVRQNARHTTLLLMGSGALIVLINLAGGWWFIRRHVLLPVSQLATASARLSKGDLDARAGLAGEDELAGLGATFDGMATSLQAKMRELEEKEQFLQQLVDAIPDGIRIIGPDYRVILANETYRRQLSPELQQVLSAICHKDAHGLDNPCPTTLVTCPLKELARDPTPLRVIHRHRRDEEAPLGVEIYAAPMRVTRQGVAETLVVESIRDLEQQIRFSHEHKLAELGRLAAGVAHEIHNPLASVRFALHGARRANHAEFPNQHQVTEFLDLVDQGIDQCIQVTERMLKLSVPPPPHPELVEFDQVVEETLSLLNWEANAVACRIEFVKTGAPLRVLAADSEIRMLTFNLAQNALHAMPRGGVLTVACGRHDQRLELVFADTGVGITAEDLAQIFDPFFSRRADGVRGYGLGLSIVKTIVDKYGGHMQVESLPAHGSRFVISFPDADQMSGS